MSLQIPEFIWNKNQWRESLDTWVTWRGHPRCGVRQRNREQDADHYNYLRSQSVIISSTSFFSLPKSECAAVLLCPRPLPLSAARKNSSKFSLGRGQPGQFIKISAHCFFILNPKSFPLTPLAASWNSQEGPESRLITFLNLRDIRITRNDRPFYCGQRMFDQL